MITLLGQKRYDLPHAIWAAKVIFDQKPSVVALELPTTFQPAIDKYLHNKVTDAGLVKAFSDLVDKRISIDTKLVDNFIKGKVSENRLDAMSPEGAFLHIIIAAKRAGVKALAVDVPLVEAEKEIAGYLRVAPTRQGAVLARAERAIHSPDSGLTTFSEVVHAPFHFFEVLVGHDPDESPFKHSPRCRLCRAGVSWERFWHSVYARYVNAFYPVAESKYVVALYQYDRFREAKMAEAVVKNAPKIGSLLLIVHLWHQSAMERLLKRAGLSVSEPI